MESNDSLFLPEQARIIGERELTSNTKLFDLHFENGKELNHEPGQFVELSIAGIGEAPISITSSP
ncbi:MAG: oxidoreductase, partial [Candidatus Bipolaricaulota bacterium]